MVRERLRADSHPEIYVRSCILHGNVRHCDLCKCFTPADPQQFVGDKEMKRLTPRDVTPSSPLVEIISLSILVLRQISCTGVCDLL